MKTPEWFNEMVLLNQWISIHALGGIIIGKAGFWFYFYKSGTIILALELALLWELLEMFYSGGFNNWYTIYGSKRRALLDSAGDVLFCVLACVMTVLL
jgi:hypothetical protein